METTKFPKSLYPAAPSPPEESAGLDMPGVRTQRGKVVLPFKYSRSSNTGHRPSAMEVAQALHTITKENDEEILNTTLEPTSPTVSFPKLRGSLSQGEKRKSTYEKYSAITLPPLPEEATPTTSPAGTLRVTAEPLGDHRKPAGPSEYSVIPQNFGLSNSALDQDLPMDDEDDTMSNEGGKVGSVESNVRLDDDQVTDLLKSPPPFQQSDDIQTISVELLSIVNNAATVISESQGIFYDSEILAVVHRVKSKASGLASTSVWCWLGKKSRLGDREDKRLQELSRRYGTRAVGAFYHVENRF